MESTTPPNNNRYTPPASPEMKRKHISPLHHKTKHGHVFKEVLKEIKHDIQSVSTKFVKSLSGRNIMNESNKNDTRQDDEQRRGSI